MFFFSQKQDTNNTQKQKKTRKHKISQKNTHTHKHIRALKAFKRSNVDLIVDKALYVIFAAQACLCLFGGFAHGIWLAQNGGEQWYQYINPDGTTETDFFIQALENLFTFLVLLDLFGKCFFLFIFFFDVCPLCVSCVCLCVFVVICTKHTKKK